MMKKTAALLIAFLSAAGAFALNAKVVSVKGKVEIQEAGMWISLEEGDVVEKGTVISTGFNSEAVLSVSNSKFTLGPLTRITIENLVSTKSRDNTQIYIDSGSLSANVAGKDGKRAGFKVRSPVATASVRGTAFTLTSSGKLSVSEGLVAFGAPESDEASVAETSEEIAEQNTETAEPSADAASVDGVAQEKSEESGDQGHANAFASTSDVGGEGVPVAAGQTSKASVAGGSPSSPRAEKAKASAGGTTTAIPASVVNSVASGSSAASPSVPEVPTASTGALSVNIKQLGALVVNCEFK